MSFPVTSKLTDNVVVDIHLHGFFLGDRDRECWTYITRGLARHGQKEMCLSLLIGDDEQADNYPKTPIKMFELLASRTKDDRQMQPGDATLLGKRGIFGFPSLFFLPAIQYPSLPSLDEHLALVLVHAEEYEYARQHGLTRLLSRLGKFCSSFPYPTWNTQIRPTLFPDNTRELSVLEDASHLRADRSYVQIQGTSLSIALHPDDLPQIRQLVDEIGQDQLQIVCSAFSPECDASLYWQSGQADNGAFASESRQTGIIGGSFFSLSRAETTGFTVLEDGFDVTLSDEDWRRVSKTMERESVCRIENDDNQTIELRFLTWDPAMPARDYEPRAVWRELTSAEPAEDPRPITTKPATGDVVLGTVSNLLGSNALENNVNKPDLQAYLTQVEQTLHAALSDETNSFHFNLDILIEEDGRAAPTVQSDAPLNPAFIRFVEELIEKILPCEVLSPIHLRLPFSVNEPT